jgi:hypothetical protein
LAKADFLNKKGVFFRAANAALKNTPYMIFGEYFFVLRSNTKKYSPISYKSTSREAASSVDENHQRFIVTRTCAKLDFCKPLFS